jgi:hypothetical protein
MVLASGLDPAALAQNSKRKAELLTFHAISLMFKTEMFINMTAH